MKKHPHLLVLAIFALLITGCAAQTVTVSWSAPTVGLPTGYKFYVSPPGSTNWNVVGTPTNTYWRIPFVNTAFGERYFVTATKDDLESPPSNIVTNLIPRSPENLRMNHTIALPQ